MQQQLIFEKIKTKDAFSEIGKNISYDIASQVPNLYEQFNTLIQSLPYYQKFEVRSKSVLGVHIMMSIIFDSASQKDMFDVQKWEADNLYWLKQFIGLDEQYLILKSRAEQTLLYRLHLIYIPIINGRLSYEKCIGSRFKLLQIEYAKFMESAYNVKHHYIKPQNISKKPIQSIKYIDADSTISLIFPSANDEESLTDYQDRVYEYMLSLQHGYEMKIDMLKDQINETGDDDITRLKKEIKSLTQKNNTLAVKNLYLKDQIKALKKQCNKNEEADKFVKLLMKSYGTKEQILQRLTTSMLLKYAYQYYLEVNDTRAALAIEEINKYGLKYKKEHNCKE